MLVDLTLAVWALLELGVRIRERVRGKGGAARDRGTRVLVALALVAVIVAALAAPLAVTPARTAGLVVMWLGLALRVWSIASLGGDFRTTVEVDADQAVVSAGPYRWVRHPSYAGLLLFVAGLGVARGAWVSLSACVVLLVPAFARRIHVEEAELERVLGDAYRKYRGMTPARLIPRVW